MGTAGTGRKYLPVLPRATELLKNNLPGTESPDLNKNSLLLSAFLEGIFLQV